MTRSAGRSDLAESLLQADLVDEKQLAVAQNERARWNNYLPRALLELGLVPERALIEVIARHFGLPLAELGARPVDPRASAILDLEFCRQHECVPLAYHENTRTLDVAVFDPNLHYDAIRFRANCNVRQHIAALGAIRDRIASAARASATKESPRFAFAGLDAAAPAASPAAPSPTTPAGLEQRVAELALRLEQCACTLERVVAELTRRGLLSREEPAPAPAAAAAPALERAASVEIDLPPVVVTLPRTPEEFDVVIDTPTDSGRELVAALAAEAARAASTVADAGRGAAEAASPPAGGQLLLQVTGASRTVVAMDFGTTRSSVGTVVDGRVEVLRLPGGEWDMPSAVAFRRDGSVMLGSAARALMATDPANCLSSPKRLLGRRYDDPAVRTYLQHLAMESSAGPAGEVVLSARGRELSVVEACAHILHLLRLVAERHLGHEVREVLLTTPVSFGEPQYAALAGAAELAELRVIEFVDEPVAAALSNASDPDCRGLVAVYDFGGGTFDFSVCELSGSELKVVATAGDGWLGGDDLDEQLAAAAANALWRQHGIELRKQAAEWQRLLVAAERVKRELSTATSSLLALPEVAHTANGAIDLELTITREQLSAICSELVRRSIDTCREALDLAGIDREQLSAVYLSGGTCYVPAVRQAVAQFFGKEPRSVVPPERSVLVGAIVSGAGLS